MRPSSQHCWWPLATIICIFVIQKQASAVPEEEPPFPVLFDPTQGTEHRVKIVSESFIASVGYQTSEEYMDFDLAKGATLYTNKDGHRVIYSDAEEGLSYEYKPYTCKVTKLSEFTNDNAYHVAAQAKVKVGNPPKLVDYYIHGIMGLWVLAARQQKAYTKSEMVYSASKDIYRPAHVWSFKYEPQKLTIKFYFMSGAESPSYDSKSLSLEMIQIESDEKNKVIETINILSVQSYITFEDYEKYLQVPIGYGCDWNESSELAVARKMSADYWGKLFDSPSLIELETTSTVFRKSNKDDSVTRDSDTVGVEMAHSRVGTNKIYLVRTRSTERDVKIIMNYKYLVEYTIDMRRGDCQVSHLNVGNDTNEMHATVKFNNGAVLDLRAHIMYELFHGDDFSFVRTQTINYKSLEHHYFEKTWDHFMNTDSTARIIRTYSKQANSIDLQSVTIWVMNKDLNDIVESYHLNVIDSRPINGWPDEPKIFDISEECYLNKEGTKNGKDYAWFELTYPASSSVLSTISNNEQALKSNIYSNFISGNNNLDFTRVPRMELMIEEEGFILRLLLLDLPPLKEIYDRHQDQAFWPDFITYEVAPDEAHCADLCRLNYCTAMTFCRTNHACYETPTWNSFGLTEAKGCVVWTLPKGLKTEDLHAASLHSILAELQHQDYGVISMPKEPEELALPRSETGISEAEHNQAIVDYMKLLANLNLPKFSIKALINEHFFVLTPTKLELENDPLNDFDLIDSDSTDYNQDERLPAFHKGLVMWTYKRELVPSNENKWNMRLFTGLTYDQCALACADSRCGSFSYCEMRHDCTITSINSTGLARSMDLVEANSDCFIAQRDFLGNFNKLSGVRQPAFHQERADATDASECALNCISKNEYRCLGFEFCSAPKLNGVSPFCYYHVQRFEDMNEYVQKEGIENKQNESITCDHYSRSFLADFLRIEYRNIVESQLAKLQTTTFDGHSVFKCAEICATELLDCTAFQFCFDPTSKSAMQQCTMIQSKPDEADASGFEAVVDEKAPEAGLVKAGQYLQKNNNCHVFSLRKDSSEAQLRDIALGQAMTVEEKKLKEELLKESQKGLSLKGGFLLYLIVALISASVGCGFCLLRDHNDYVRRKIERARILIGL